jgi:RHS repeat-associated protein
VPGPAIDEPIARVDAAGNKTFFHTNHQGSVIAMSGSGAALAEGPYTYDPYGNCFSGGNPCGSAGEPYRFTGRRLDPETGLYYYRARYYDPQKGRFLQTDPVGYAADLNLYTYVGSDPIDKTDPTGVCPECLIGAGVNMGIEWGTMYVEAHYEGRDISPGEFWSRIALAGGAGALAGATGIGVISIATRAERLANLARATSTFGKVARAGLRIAAHGAAGAAGNVSRDLVQQPGTQLIQSGGDLSKVHLNWDEIGADAAAGAKAGAAFGTGHQFVSSALTDMGATTGAAQMGNINNTLGRFTLGASTVISGASDAIQTIQAQPSKTDCMKAGVHCGGGLTIIP